MQKARIVIILTQMEGGGAQSAGVKLAHGLRARGHDVEMWFLYQKRPSHAHEPGVRVLLPHPVRSPLDGVRIFARLLSAVRRSRPDAVLTFTHYANVLGQVAAWLARIPCRVASQRSPAWSHPRLARWADRVIGSLGLYTGNVAVSRSVCQSFDRYPRRYRARLTVVENGIIFSPSAQSMAEARREFNLPLDVPLIVTCGRLSWPKNQKTLLRAMARLPDAHLAIAGEGELRAPLMALSEEIHITPRVHFLGEVPHARIADVLRAADLFALPSRYEGMSNALLEAMSAGLPVVVSDIPAQADVVRVNGEEPAGILVPPGDGDAWVRELADLLANPARRAQLAGAARRRAAYFTMDRMVDGFEQCVLKDLGR